MSIPAVEKAIRSVRKQIPDPDLPGPDDDNTNAPVRNELFTRYVIIDPVLRALGWDPSNPAQCVVEYQTPRGGRADYALLDRQRKPAVLVEAKRVGGRTDDDANQEQVEKYAREVGGIRAVAITNGEYWDIFHKVDEAPEWDDEGEWEHEGGERPLGLMWHDVKENAKRLHDALARELYW